MSKTIAVIPGDGIGPEIMTATLRVLDALDCGLEYDFAEAGMVALDKCGDLLPKETLDKIAQHKVALKGPLTTPIGGGFTSINVTLRRHFDLYANVRPAISFPGTKSRFENIDIITVRENTEGAYLAEGQTLSEDGEVAQSIIRNTRKGSSRIVRGFANSACTLAGDSGGAIVTGSLALGITSGSNSSTAQSCTEANLVLGGQAASLGIPVRPILADVDATSGGGVGAGVQLRTAPAAA